MNFTKGMKVYFGGPDGRIYGTVMRVNKKTVSVDPGRDGEYYRVAPDILRVAEDELAVALRETGIAHLRITQDQLQECLQAEASEDAPARLERLAAVVHNPSGRLTIVADREDIERGLHHGWVTMALLMHAAKSALTMAGRLDLAVTGYDDDPRALFQIPEVQRWLSTLQSLIPWLGAWLDPSVGTAFQLVGALAPWEVQDGRPVLREGQVHAAVHIANYAVAFTEALGGSHRRHVDRFLEFLGVRNLPEGFFAGIEGLAAELDEAGLRGPSGQG